MISEVTRSLSARVLGVFVLTSLVYVGASRYVFDLVWGTGYLSEVIGAHMALHVDYVLNDIGVPPRIERAQAIVDKVPVDILITGPDSNWASDTRFPPLEEVPFARSRFLLPGSVEERPAWMKTVELIELARRDNRAFVKIHSGAYDIIFASPKFSEPPRPQLTTPIIAVLAVVVLAGCYFAVRWLMKPIRWIKEGAARIGQGDLDYRIPATRKDDLGELAADINRMADDVREMLEAKRQLLLAISHELRSPLTRAKVALEFLDDESIKANLLNDIREMEQLIADLLESERLNTRHSKLQLAEVDLDDLVASVVAADLGEGGQHVALHLPAAPVTLQADATRLRLLVKNLAENALRYTEPDRPPVEITVSASADSAEIRVCDHGRGMSAHDLARATEPFYRADPARSRATGGLGLGLYLCRRIAEAHGGSLAIQSELGCGTEVTVRIPRRLAAAA
ncbi:MAG: HAMP domain-containing histidine kinase [Gammaproteobacteria bacterium]|nr:HAMP domain-containing histidine kinase [Gammaproteobacteria bacterium]